MNETTPTFWPIGPVTTDAATQLTDWRAFQVRMPALGGAESRHLVGYAVLHREGRVSSPVVDFDPKTSMARTRSGRCYELVGASGTHADADYVWRRWLSLNSVDEAEARDVTNDLKRQVQEAAR
mgnify:CR=1 FL=1